MCGGALEIKSRVSWTISMYSTRSFVLSDPPPFQQLNLLPGFCPTNNQAKRTDKISNIFLWRKGHGWGMVAVPEDPSIVWLREEASLSGMESQTTLHYRIRACLNFSFKDLF